jgi:hypothetical protein
MLNIYSYDIYFYNNDFQTPATPISEGILHFYHDLIALLTFFCFFVLWILSTTLILFSYEKESNLILNRGIYFFNYFKNQSMILEIVWSLITPFALTTESYSDVNYLINSNHAKVNSRNPLITIIKRSVHTSSNRIFLESNKNAQFNFKKPLISILKRGIKTSKKKKKSFIKNVDKTILINTDEKNIHPIFLIFYNIFIKGILRGVLFAIPFLILHTIFEEFINSLDWCNFFLETLKYNSTKYYNSLNYIGTTQINLETDLKQLQTWLINYGLNSMVNNEFCFKFYPNTISFQNYKILYQEELKIFLEKLDLERFENPDEALRFISAFYEHYFKIIEFNTNSTISQITTK